MSRSAEVLNEVYLFNCDSPFRYQLHFQDPVTTYMEEVFYLNHKFFILIVAIISFVGWMMISILVLFFEKKTRKILTFYHSAKLEGGWTIAPLVILGVLLNPSLTLLYSLIDEQKSDVTMKILGHQWYWEYEITEGLLCLPEQVTTFCAYHLIDDYMCLDKSGIKRNLEADRRVIFPLNFRVKMTVSGADVLHSWTIPSFGIKVDACPGRSNIVYVVAKRCGLFFGQCSEICGVNHGFMPVAAITVHVDSFRLLLNMRVNNVTHMW